MKARLRPRVAALLLPPSLLIPAAVALAPLGVLAADADRPQIQSLALNADEGLQPGSQLDISVQGTPDARATVNFGRTHIVVPLSETSSGKYVGHYTVRHADHIDPNATMTVSLTRGNATARHSFTYPPSFQALAAAGSPAKPPQATESARIEEPPVPPLRTAAAPRIERFTALQVGRLEPGRELRYRVTGLPGARVTLEIPGIVERFPMDEVSPGVYETTYTLRERDDPDAFRIAIATLRSGDRWVTSRLDRGNAPEIEVHRPVAVTTDLPLAVFSPGNGGIVDANGTVIIEGRTAPHARVHVRVDAVPPHRGGMYGVAETVFEDTVHADEIGHFSAAVDPSGPVMPGTRYEVSLRARDGDQTAEVHLTVRQRG
ncbi:MAG TPA: hypothetical protein VHA82_05875 [Ramlibacter sp.]|uniref:hypothetical protein n=1 Tax=Ramlibacter sp. TaxID=1917967 RepID=UPI002CE37D6F|nr:hypothetical protein [Ramlibacter sp.]HVZ43320.1 hypothetical protein [Ramlibacter sp.]